LEYYASLKPGEPAANDDLDLQILWLKAMQDHGGWVEARILADYWRKHVPVDWNEYGVGKANLRSGMLPPLSGEFNNAQWKHSNGAWIRSEIWACLAPGCPELAARMAREDACVDHGAAEGTLAEIFTASIESAAFVEHDRDRLIAYGLSAIPEGCGVARAVKAAIQAKTEGKDWKAAREEVLRSTEDTGWFQAPRNVAFTMIGWLYGENDFGKSICIAVNCGDDTDCTGATLGSILGIIGGTKAIPEAWKAPIGDGIRTVAVAGIPVPKDLHALTDSTVAMAKTVLAKNSMPASISGAPSEIRDVSDWLERNAAAVRPLWTLSPYRIVWTQPAFRITLDYRGDPIISPGEGRACGATVENLSLQSQAFRLGLRNAPTGWKVQGLPPEPFFIASEGRKDFTIDFFADRIADSLNVMGLSVVAQADSAEIPIALLRSKQDKSVR
jgi:ADP-ribosylglycohydrolase